MEHSAIDCPIPSIENIKTLSRMTGCGLMYCKKALMYTECDMQKAEALLQDLTGGVVIRPNPWDEAEKKWKEKYEGAGK
jgi:translation elongation factor EF-Ts